MVSDKIVTLEHQTPCKLRNSGFPTYTPFVELLIFACKFGWFRCSRGKQAVLIILEICYLFLPLLNYFSSRWLREHLETVRGIDMAVPKVLINTYCQVFTKDKIDSVTKMFIICAIPFGIVRLPLIGNFHPIFIILSVLYSIVTTSYLISYFNVQDVTNTALNIALGSYISQCIFLMIYNLISIKRLKRYFDELRIFDETIGCLPKIGKTTLRNIVLTLLLFIFISITFILSYAIESFRQLNLEFIPLIVSHVLEIHFIGHLLSLLIPRLCLINYYMELSLSSSNVAGTASAEGDCIGDAFGLSSLPTVVLCKMKKIMQFYCTIIKAYNYLIEAVKWQLLVMIISSFISILCYSFYVANALINDKTPVTLVICGLGLSVATLLPLFAPCIIADQIHNEVLRLRELLGSRLFENQLDKSSRDIARTILTWTEKRDLSLSLLRMLNIDISFPFKFVGLLVMYLIILLQFQKVINP